MGGIVERKALLSQKGTYEKLEGLMFDVCGTLMVLIERGTRARVGERKSEVFHLVASGGNIMT